MDMLLIPIKNLKVNVILSGMHVTHTQFTKLRPLSPSRH